MEENKVMNIELTPEMFEKLDDSKKNSEKIAYESKTYIADAWNRFKKIISIDWVMLFIGNGNWMYLCANFLIIHL